MIYCVYSYNNNEINDLFGLATAFLITNTKNFVMDIDKMYLNSLSNYGHELIIVHDQIFG